jgi:translation initiation factor 2 beta subunit (eIF-2beta)/eIF-5
MTLINMNGNKLDTNYRYTMPEFNITIAGKSSGICTIINNIKDISKSINHPPEVIMKYIASVTGSNYIQTRESITGSHTVEELTDIIIEYIRYLVFCQRCFIPETIPCLSGSKKKIKLEFCCSGCKTTTIALSPNKRIEKGIDIIIKYLKTESEWKMEKGTVVSQDNKLVELTGLSGLSGLTRLDGSDELTGLTRLDGSDELTGLTGLTGLTELTKINKSDIIHTDNEINPFDFF